MRREKACWPTPAVPIGSLSPVRTMTGKLVWAAAVRARAPNLSVSSKNDHVKPGRTRSSDLPQNRSNFASLVRAGLSPGIKPTLKRSPRGLKLRNSPTKRRSSGEAYIIATAGECKMIPDGLIWPERIPSFATRIAVSEPMLWPYRNRGVLGWRNRTHSPNSWKSRSHNRPLSACPLMRWDVAVRSPCCPRTPVE